MMFKINPILTSKIAAPEMLFSKQVQLCSCLVLHTVCSNYHLHLPISSEYIAEHKSQKTKQTNHKTHNNENGTGSSHFISLTQAVLFLWQLGKANNYQSIWSSTDDIRTPSSYR